MVWLLRRWPPPTERPAGGVMDFGIGFARVRWILAATPVCFRVPDAFFPKCFVSTEGPVRLTGRPD